MAIATQIPGFIDPVSDAQRTFRAVLDALAHPGQRQTTGVNLRPPEGFSQAMAAVCLTLLDLDVAVWLQPGLACRDWLVFHTGCRLTEQPQQADFAVVCDRTPSSIPPLMDINPGTPDYPEAATTVLYQLQDLTQGPPVTLRGPGIQQETTISPQVSADFWPQWQGNQQRYPLGVDVLFVAGNQVLGLPRSVQMVSK